MMTFAGLRCCVSLCSATELNYFVYLQTIIKQMLEDATSVFIFLTVLFIYSTMNLRGACVRFYKAMASTEIIAAKKQTKQ